MIKTITLAVFLLNPARLYFQPDQPVTVQVGEQPPAQIVLLSPEGKVEAKASLEGAKAVDLAAKLPAVWDGSTHHVQGVDAEGKAVGTPLVVVPLWPPEPNLREHLKQQREGKPMGLRVYPETRAVLHTSEGDITIGFSPEVAPNTVKNFTDLVAGGLYTNVPFHRILPGFVIQGGDPTGTGMGGPGHMIDLEASSKKHVYGTLSMARSRDPNSAGSQFFICIGEPEHLNNQYAAFGDVVEGLDAVKKIAATPLADPRAGKPRRAPVIKSAELIPAPPRNIAP